MKILALTLTLLIAVSGVALAQPKTERKAADKASPSLMTGKVTQVDAAARTFTVASEKGQTLTFSLNRPFKKPLKVGEEVDVTYTGPPGGGVMAATSVKSAKSNASY
jgi:hypothetical protein